MLSEDGILYFGTFGNQLHALDTRSRRELWVYTASHWVWGSPLLAEDQVILTDLSGNLIAVDAQSGRELWKINTGAAITASPTRIGEVLYIGNEAGQLYAVNLQGQSVWGQPKIFDGKILSAALAGDEVILIPMIAKDNLVIAINPDGGQAWSFQPVK